MMSKKTANKDYTKVCIVHNILEARKQISDLQYEGYWKENIFVLAHDKKRTKHAADNTDGNQIGISEEGAFTAIANLFRSTGDALRAKLKSMGVSEERAHHLEEELDSGKIVILAWSGVSYDNGVYDEGIYYSPDIPNNYSNHNNNNNAPLL
jgi:uncharacterized protein with NRDE domain